VPALFLPQGGVGIERPSMAFPKIFTRIDSLMKRLFEGRPTSEITPELPPGRVAMQGKWVNSAPIEFPGVQASCYIKGAFDSVLVFDDGSYAVIDFKTSSPSKQHIGFYSRQLSAYAYALEHPGEKALHLAPISKLGLLYLDPIDINHGADHRRITYDSEVTWQELPKDEGKSLEFIHGVLELLSLPEPPLAHPECGFCAYREAAREHWL
jgi:hypothetical protein